MTAGVFASKILLPKRLLSELSERELAAVLDHEFTHAERRDGAFNFLRLLVRDLLWFSPFAAWLARRFEENMELSVDSTVLAHGAITARSYAEMLLRLSGEGELEALPAAHMSRHFIFRRIAAMKLPAKSAGTLPSRRWVTRASVLAFFLLGLAGYSVFGIASPARADSIRMVRYEVLKFECNNGLLTCQSLIGTEFVYQLSQECGCGGPAGVENFLHYKRYP
jgi:beta-lactamase regulating signal transducer with metallopeptidase domain